MSLAGKRRGFSSRTGSVGIDCKDRSLVTSVPKSKLLMQTQHKNKIHSTTWRHAPSVKHITLAYIGVFMVDIPQLWDHAISCTQLRSWGVASSWTVACSRVIEQSNMLRYVAMMPKFAKGTVLICWGMFLVAMCCQAPLQLSPTNSSPVFDKTILVLFASPRVLYQSSRRPCTYLLKAA